MSTRATAATGLPARGQVRLHVLEEPAALAADAAGRFAEWLSADEKERWQRFRHAADRQRFLLARALTRSVLGNCLQQAPASLQFTRNRYGKPELVQAKRPEQILRFNLSHTRGLLVLGVTLVDEIGVDVEAVTREVEMLPLAERYFAASEIAMLHAAEPSQLRELFFRLWTLKEAYVKASGLGMQLGFHTFGFALAGDGTPQLQHAAGDAGAEWSFAVLQQADNFRIAVAVSAGGIGSGQISLRRHDCDML